MLIIMPASDPRSLLLVDVPLMFGSTGSVVAFYVTADMARGGTFWGAIKKLPPLMALGCGMSPYLTKAVFQGMGNITGEFIRTPKKGEKTTAKQRYHARTNIPWIELVLGVTNFVAVFVAIATQHLLAAPFALMFSLGYLWVGGSVMRERSASETKAAKNEITRPAFVPVATQAELAFDGPNENLSDSFRPSGEHMMAASVTSTATTSSSAAA